MRSAATRLLVNDFASGPGSFIRAVGRFTRASIRIIDEPDELLVHPLRMLSDIETEGVGFGDCDDVSMFSAALLTSVGIPARFRAVSPDPDYGHYRHVFTEYYLGGEWFPLDLTLSTFPVYDGPSITAQV